MSLCTKQSAVSQHHSYQGVIVDDFNLWPYGSSRFIEDLTNRAIEHQRTFACYLNAYTYNISVADEQYRSILKSADILYPDGMSISLAAWLSSGRWIERMTGLDFSDSFFSACEERGLSLYFLGGKPGIAERAKQNILRKYPNLKIVGTHNGYFSLDGEDVERIINDINQSQVDILLIGMGSPLQEEFGYRYRNKLNSPVIWVVGALLDYYAGVEKQAPRWIGRIGLEWLFRLIQNPKGKWKRYLVGNWIFAYNIYRAIVKGRANETGNH